MLENAHAAEAVFFQCAMNAVGGTGGTTGGIIYIEMKDVDLRHQFFPEPQARYAQG